MRTFSRTHFGDWMCLVMYDITMCFTDLVSIERMSNQDRLERLREKLLIDNPSSLVFVRFMTPAEIKNRQLPA